MKQSPFPVLGTSPTRPALDSQVAEIIRELADLGGSTEPRSPAKARRDASRAFDVLRGTRSDESLENVTWEIVVDHYPHGEVSVREYMPRSLRRESITTTVVLLHGGGWVTGSASSYHDDASLFAARLQARVLSVDYRLAPEEPFPAAFDDAVAVVRRELNANATTRIVVVGDSAGGNLALATALAVRGFKRNIDALVLLYPALDPDGMGNETYESNGQGYILETADMAYYFDAYLGANAAEVDESGAPLRAHNFVGLPPTIIASAGYDPLLADSRQLADRLIADDIATIYLPNHTLTHGFLQMRTRVDQAHISIEQVFKHLTALLSST